MFNWQTRWGIFRSWMIYYGKPGNRRRLRQFYSQVVGSGALCFDIGAHLGNRTQAFLDLGAQVVAVEPQAACIRFLDRKFGKNERVSIVPAAVGAREGKADLYVNLKNPTITTLTGTDWRSKMASAAPTRERWENARPVPLTTLDALISAYGLPDFCKIDVEGYEEEVLRGLSQPLPCLSFEFLSFELAAVRACIAHLETLGAYRYNWVQAERLAWALPEWVPAAQLLTAIDIGRKKVYAGDIFAKRSPE